ncbi:hypothetical protein LAX5112_04985 [Roseibium alexandrii]|uniref:Uncharacterized protein n=1 Tax=Roseibium alexandrii TaxID=388408 RepID=A0A0M7AT44_9HYPH|nr:hypothetical protein LAX5112_04985 [Roseibium alexandrii]
MDPRVTPEDDGVGGEAFPYAQPSLWSEFPGPYIRRTTMDRHRPATLSTITPDPIRVLLVSREAKIMCGQNPTHRRHTHPVKFTCAGIHWNLRAEKGRLRSGPAGPQAVL